VRLLNASTLFFGEYLGFHSVLYNFEALKIGKGSGMDQLAILVGRYELYLLHLNHCFHGHQTRAGRIINPLSELGRVKSDGQE
jgi:hypothetical protein